MILYRKTASLKVRRASAPEPPFWCATTIAPYSGKRGLVDYTTSRAAASDRNEVTVCENVRDELERARAIAAPVLIDAAESAEIVFRRGEEALAFCDEQRLPALYLTSTRGTLPPRALEGGRLVRPMSAGADEDVRPPVIAIAAWPVELARLDDLFAQAPPAQWGVVVPVIYPITTDLETLDTLAQQAKQHGASFFAPMPVDVDATAKQSIAHELQLAGDDDRYEMLFHAEIEPVHLATERHIAALAHEHGMSDFVIPPRWNERTNWNAAVLLTLTASRMIAMELDLDLAGVIARSARAVAELDKPLTRIAEAASLSIIGSIDETSAEMLTEWLAGKQPGFAEYVSEQWRLSRSSGARP